MQLVATISTPLAMTTSDHVPSVVAFQSSIPKAHIFRLENRWLHMDGLIPLVEHSCSHSIQHVAAKRISAKFKILGKN
jgi:hypothetical protein